MSLKINELFNIILIFYSRNKTPFKTYTRSLTSEFKHTLVPLQGTAFLWLWT